eukprot:jgi/Mesvir1/26971/Mv20685-RA.1
MDDTLAGETNFFKAETPRVVHREDEGTTSLVVSLATPGHAFYVVGRAGCEPATAASIKEGKLGSQNALLKGVIMVSAGSTEHLRLLRTEQLRPSALYDVYVLGESEDGSTNQMRKIDFWTRPDPGLLPDHSGAAAREAAQRARKLEAHKERLARATQEIRDLAASLTAKVQAVFDLDVNSEELPDLVFKPKKLMLPAVPDLVEKAKPEVKKETLKRQDESRLPFLGSRYRAVVGGARTVDSKS